jgi:hypothetical protein
VGHGGSGMHAVVVTRSSEGRERTEGCVCAHLIEEDDGEDDAVDGSGLAEDDTAVPWSHPPAHTHIRAHMKEGAQYTEAERGGRTEWCIAWE